MMLTRCPACQTVFRLRAEQLRARHGEVRCGHCFNPFNALDHLLAESPSSGQVDTHLAPAPDLAPAPAPALDPPAAMPAAAAGAADPPTPPHEDESTAPAASGVTHTLLSDLDFDVPDSLVGDSGPPRAAGMPRREPDAERREPRLDEVDFSAFLEADPESLRAEPEPEPPRILGAGLAAFPLLEPLERGTELAPHAAPAPRTPFSADAPEHDGYPPEPGPPAPPPLDLDLNGDEDDAPALQAQTGPFERAVGVEPDPPAHSLLGANNEFETDRESELEDPDEPEQGRLDTEYLDATYGKPAPTSALQRTLWGLTLGLLAGILAMQATYLFRQDLARTLPGLRPLLLAACERLGCDMPLPREAASITIETSDLQSEPGRGTRFILHATLRNRAEFVQAWPHLELTLTDGADTPLARRVFAPHEWVAPGRLGAGFAARGDAVVRQAFDVSEIAPTGYRVYVFYP